MPSLGSRQLRDISRDLKVAASPKGLRGELRRNIAAAVQPMKQQVQRNAFAIPAAGSKQTGLRVAIMRATKIRISLTSRNVLVRLMVDASSMPAGQEQLPALMEGDGVKWRHPVYGNTETWVAQASHPYFRPAIPPHLPGVNAGVLAAVDRTAAQLSKGT
jgi:hypothetical protein